MPPKSKRVRQEPEKATLQFKQSLGKGLASSEILKRLKALHLELADLDQELIDTTSLDTVAKELIAPFLLLHKEKGVKAYLACCLVDVLRLYAPEAPYTGAELKDLFQFIIRQLKHLTTASEPHFSEYFYVVESLSNVKSIVIICDLESGDELMADLFKQCFDVITRVLFPPFSLDAFHSDLLIFPSLHSPQSPKNVQISIADILSQLVEEVSQLSSEVVDCLLAQFLPKNVKTNQSAYLLAVEVCKASADKLQRYVCQYFAETITSTINGAKESEDEDTDTDGGGGAGGKRGKGGNTVEQLPTGFVMAHSLIKQINRSVPTLLLNVIPQLEEELGADKPAYRKLAAETLGAMSGEKAGQGDLALKYPTAWRGFLGRSKDKVSSVRMAVVESLPKIWTEHPELASDIEAVMTTLLLDTDDKVRIAACTAFEVLDFETTSTHVSKTMLVSLGSRCLDTKPAIRNVAFNTLGHLYHLAFPEIESRDEHATEHYGWIPGQFMDALRNPQPAIQNLINTKVLEFIVPFPKKDEEEAQWVDRLLLVMQHLEPEQREALLHLTHLQDPKPGPFESFISACEANNGGVIDKDEDATKALLKHCTKAVASDQQKAGEDLIKFAKANEKQLYKLLRAMLDPQLDLKTQLKSWKDCTRRLEQISSTIVETFNHCLRRNAYLINNRSSISTLLARVKSPPSGPDGAAISAVAAMILSFVSKRRPALYKTHVAELTKSLGDGSPEQLVSVALHALSRLAKTDRSALPDKKLSERAKHFARSGTPLQAKQAATIVALDTARPGSADDLVEYLADALADASEDELIPKLSALNRLARYAPSSFENKSEQITTSALEILTRGTVPGEVLDDDEALWVSEEDMDDVTKARILAVKILTSRCLGYDDDDESAAKASVPVFQLLWPLLQARDDRHSPPVASHLRLVSALSILKLASSDKFMREIMKKFDVLARVAQDTCYEVRSAFVNKLGTLMRNRIVKSPRFNMVFFMVAHDPELDVIQAAESFIKSRMAGCTIRRFSIIISKLNAVLTYEPTPVRRQTEWEHPFVRLIHLLAHHPDFSGDEDDEDDLKLMAKYIQMYVSLVVNKENIPFIYHITVKLKQIQDSESRDFDKKLYILSELSQHLLNRAAANNQWPIPTHPKDVPMPADIFRGLTTAKATEVVKKNYLSAEILSKVAPMGKPSKPKVLKPKAEVTTPKKRKSSPKPNGKAKRTSKPKKKERKWNSGSEDESDPESEEEDELDTDEDGNDRPAKKFKARPPPPPESKRASLARGKKSPEKKSPAPKVDKVSKKASRGVVKGLNAPRAMKINKDQELSDLSDLSDDDAKMKD
ncbi:sister chromatid cohesion protein PDS5, partial [Phenoliferia sp. Uapishka_3]